MLRWEGAAAVPPLEYLLARFYAGLSLQYQERRSRERQAEKGEHREGERRDHDAGDRGRRSRRPPSRRAAA